LLLACACSRTAEAPARTSRDDDDGADASAAEAHLARGKEAKAISMPDSRVLSAIELMGGFAERTAITSDRPQQRYLWTDSFAVCNFLGLSRATGDEQYRQLALRLVDRVHQVLGRHRGNGPRTGWISGLSDREGENHPTQGGLRIGKRLTEREPAEPFDEALEWDRDGQYFHYLTKWMQALDLVARSTRDPRFSRWARELAAKAHAAFSYTPSGGGRSRLYWKMSIDLSRPLVSSMGHHDPLDGFVTLVQLQTTATALTAGPQLDHEIADLASMMEGRDWTTADPLGLGGLLMDAYRVQQLMRHGAPFKGELLERLLEAARVGLSDYARQGDWRRPAATRLAFRELGLAIGLQAAERMRRALDAPQEGSRARAHPEVRKQLEAILRHAPLRAEIETFWLGPENRRAPSWSEHRDINEVMLATSLAPDGCLVLPPLQ
jgi:hypothetical protein